MDDPPPSPPLETQRHLRYWTRCLRSLLPHHYTSNDGNRMALGYFILSALDLLTPDDSPPTPAAPASAHPHLLTSSDRFAFRQWILSCQHPGGGFAGSPNLALPGHACEGWDFARGCAVPAHTEVANLPATCFALMLLAILAGDDDAEGAFGGVDRARTLRWLKGLQRGDGSFGEVQGGVKGRTVGGDGDLVAGGRDMRYCYLAAMLRWMLRGEVCEGDAEWVEDVDVDGLVKYIGRSQTYDGGIAESSQHEHHAGYAYCAISALSLIDRPLENSPAPHGGRAVDTALPSLPSLTHFLLSRQFAYHDTRSEEEDGDGGDDNPAGPPSLSALSVDEHPPRPLHAGFNGRCNKVADTCYTWWVTGTLSVLGEAPLLSRAAARCFLLEKTQHPIGGFAKHPGGPPDVYHAYFGLAALAVAKGGEPGLAEFDAALAVTARTARRLEAARRGLLGRAREAARGAGVGAKVLEMGVLLRGERPAWLAAGGG